MKDGRAKLLARYLACMPDKQVEALTAVESLGQRTSYLEGALGTGWSLAA